YCRLALLEYAGPSSRQLRGFLSVGRPADRTDGPGLGLRFSHRQLAAAQVCGSRGVTVVAIPADGLAPSAEQARAWCAQLEAGEILFFPQSPVPLPPGDGAFLLGQQQADSSLHKNIAYKPNIDR